MILLLEIEQPMVRIGDLKAVIMPTEVTTDIYMPVDGKARYYSNDSLFNEETVVPVNLKSAVAHPTFEIQRYKYGKF